MEMESNLPVVAKKFWHMVRVALFMLRKGISKCKLLADLNMLMKRGKIAGKLAIRNLMFHHGHRSGGSSTATSTTEDANDNLSFTTHPDDYEFSCSNSPATSSGFHLPFHLNKRKNKRSYAPPMEDESMAASAVAKALEILQSEVVASPALPGLGRSPAMVRQLRITDSPFPLRDDEDSRHVDEAAEQFISNFYKYLRRQSEQL